MTKEEEQKTINQIQEEIRQVVPENAVLKNTPESRRNVRLKLQEVLQKYDLPEYSVVCDATNNPKWRIDAKQFRADIIIKFNLDQKGGHRIVLNGGKKNPFDRR